MQIERVRVTMGGERSEFLGKRAEINILRKDMEHEQEKNIFGEEENSVFKGDKNDGK